MKKPTFSRRDILQGSTAVAIGAFASPAKVMAAAPPATAITPQLIEAAKKEGKVVYYTSIDLPVAEKIAKAFEAKFPGIAVRVERTGAERVFQRIGQEYSSRIHAVDVVNSSDAAHFIVWKREGILEPFVPEDVAKHYKDGQKDADGTFAGFRVGLSVIAYNTSLVKKEDAPKSFADLLDPKWMGKIVKAHPGYSGTIMTATQQTARDLGWEFLEKLAKQKVMQVQSGVRSAQEARARRARGAGGRQRIQSAPDQGRERAGGDRLSDRGRSAHRRSERHLQGRAEPERGAAVPVLLLHGGVPAARGRRRQAAVPASADQGDRRAQAVPRDQDHERGCRRRREGGEAIKARYSKLFGV